MRNMKKVTRAMAMTLASMLCLSACAGEPANNQTVSGQPVEDSSEVKSTEDIAVKPYWELLNEVSDTSELPDWEGDTLEVSIWFAAGVGQTFTEIPETDVAFKEFERVTGVKFNLEESFDNGGNNIDAKLPMVVGSGDFPTMVIGYGIETQLGELIENGYLTDLTEYYQDGTLDQITKWLPLEEMDQVIYEDAKSNDGRYYLIPNGDSAAQTVKAWSSTGYYPEEVYDAEYYSLYGANPANAAGRSGMNAFMVRTDILEALRPDALTMKEIQDIYVKNGTFTEEEIYSVNLNSADEFYAFLREIKELLDSEDYVGLDGNPMEVIYGPHTETDNYYVMCWWLGLLDGAETEYFSYVNFGAEDESELIQYAYESDYFIDYMKDINSLVRDDVIAQDSMLDNMATYQEKLNNLHYAVTYCENMTNVCSDVGAEVDYTPIWVKADFNEEIGGDAAYNFNYYYGIFKDALSEEELDQLMHAINYLNSIVGTNNFYWGPKSAGLFTEDADGNRTYTTEALHNYMVNKEANGEGEKYGLMSTGVVNDVCSIRPKSLIQGLLNPVYLAADDGERAANDAQKYFCPGVLPGQSRDENAIYVNVEDKIYSSISNEIQGLKDFWAARNGYENQIKKVLVAESDAEFEKQLENLQLYARENGLTDEVKKQHNDMYIEVNRDKLVEAGIIK